MTELHAIEVATPTPSAKKKTGRPKKYKDSQTAMVITTDGAVIHVFNTIAPELFEKLLKVSKL